MANQNPENDASSVNSGNIIHVNRRHMNILDEEPIPEEQNLYIIHEPDTDQADTMTLMKTYFDKKFSTLKRQLKDEKEDTIVEAKRHKKDIDFKYKSNKTQFEFNQDLCDNIEISIFLKFKFYNVCNSAVIDKQIYNDVKGSLRRHYSFWKNMSTSNKILDIIKNGYKIPFIDTPAKAHFNNNRSAFENFELVTDSVNELVNIGSVLEVPFLPHVISPLSVSTSSCGKKRLILDLRYLNSQVFKEYIRFDDWRSFESYLNKDNFVYKFDLKKGYHHIDICSEHQTYLGFSWVINGELKYFVFTVLPFGLTSAPYIFTKVLRPILNLWHSRGIQISLFLDDGIWNREML